MAGILHKQIDLKHVSPNTYSVSWHVDWTLGTTLFGGGAAAQIHYAAATHLVTDSALLARNQPDILSMHLEFLRPCERRDSIITVTTLKTGAVSSTIQPQLSQNGKIRIVALATSTNFDKILGPSAATDWTLYPSPPPKPRFDRVMASLFRD